MTVHWLVDEEIVCGEQPSPFMPGTIWSANRKWVNCLKCLEAMP